MKVICNFLIFAGSGSKRELPHAFIFWLNRFNCYFAGVFFQCLQNHPTIIFPEFRLKNKYLIRLHIQPKMNIQYDIVSVSDRINYYLVLSWWRGSEGIVMCKSRSCVKGVTTLQNVKFEVSHDITKRVPFSGLWW